MRLTNANRQPKAVWCRGKWGDADVRARRHRGRVDDRRTVPRARLGEPRSADAAAGGPGSGRGRQPVSPRAQRRHRPCADRVLRPGRRGHGARCDRAGRPARLRRARDRHGRRRTARRAARQHRRPQIVPKRLCRRAPGPRLDHPSSRFRHRHPQPRVDDGARAQVPPGCARSLAYVRRAPARVHAAVHLHQVPRPRRALPASAQRAESAAHVPGAPRQPPPGRADRPGGRGKRRLLGRIARCPATGGAERALRHVAAPARSAGRVTRYAAARARGHAAPGVRRPLPRRREIARGGGAANFRARAEALAGASTFTAWVALVGLCRGIFESEFDDARAAGDFQALVDLFADGGDA